MHTFFVSFKKIHLHKRLNDGSRLGLHVHPLRISKPEVVCRGRGDIYTRIGSGFVADRSK